jgi:type I restriction-modification system DNA methylase subunit
MKEALKQVSLLVERFVRNIEAYRSPAYNETQLRVEFIDPFFEALGWDVTNKAGYAEQYKDVIHEDAIKVSGATKAPDYCFRIGGVRKFFLETKKPSIDIKVQVNPAYQLRRYAWSAKLPLSILTDFEELAIYDCRLRPKPNDKPSIGRVRLYTCTQYIDSFEDMHSLLSKESVLKGSFDRFAESEKQKRGTTEVDAEFLKEIESWRETLAKDMALRNPKLSVHELNYAVQLTIDRIIFLRMCEDRGIEKYGQIQTLLNGTNTYHRLREFFYKADDKYNSGLFDFRADRLTPELKIDDNPLKEIFKNLYYPESPYEFSVLGADILGQVYEQFLGKVIRLTEGHRAKVEEKPEVRKAGGVYYTPTYIVEYIVNNTVGKIVGAVLRDRPDKGTHRGVPQQHQLSPQQISRIRILDPACGSGSFLLGAYQYLLNYHLSWYQKDGPQKHSQEIYQGYGGQWYLTTREKKRILLNNIYGVDIDPQAVEVTKISLLLKVLEGENQDSLERQIKLFKERALPDLGSNIKCGNSLIGPDFYQGKQMNLLDSEEAYRINAFDWKKEFPEIMNRGGFDAVIGNPPYLFITELAESDKEYFFRRYKSAEYRFDVYGLFIELAIDRLLKGGGYLSFIVPHTLLSNSSFIKLRRLILSKTCLNQVVDIGSGVFGKAKNETMIFVLRYGIRPKLDETAQVTLTTARTFPQGYKVFSIPQTLWANAPGATWTVKISPADMSVVTKLSKAQYKFGDLCTINQGLRTGDNEKYLSKNQKTGQWKPVVGGKHVGRYKPLTRDLYVYYEPEVLDAPRRKEIFESAEKLIVQEVRNIMLPRRLIATYDDQGFYCLQSTNVINLRTSQASRWNLKFLLGILNSNLANSFFRQRFSGNNHIASNQLAQIPVSYADPGSQDAVVKMVEHMLSLEIQLARSKTSDEKTRIQRRIDATDHQIDQLVYELYGLTDKEIQIVMQATT